MKLLRSIFSALATVLLFGAFVAGFSTWNPRITTCGIILSIGVYIIAVASIYVSNASASYISTFSWFCFAFIVILLTGNDSYVCGNVD